VFVGFGGGQFENKLIVNLKDHFHRQVLGFDFSLNADHGTRYLEDVLVGECGMDLTGWTLERATGVSADGITIVGYGTNPYGFTERWIAVIPEPASFLLLAFGGLALLRTRKSSAFRGLLATC
jgi:hypothetical protein